MVEEYFGDSSSEEDDLPFDEVKDGVTEECPGGQVKRCFRLKRPAVIELQAESTSGLDIYVSAHRQTVGQGHF